MLLQGGSLRLFQPSPSSSAEIKGFQTGVNDENIPPSSKAFAEWWDHSQDDPNKSAPYRITP
jgi:hypothetical protein